MKPPAAGEFTLPLDGLEGASDALQCDGRGQPPQRTSDSQKGRDTGSEGLEIGDSEQKAKIDMAEMGGR